MTLASAPQSSELQSPPPQTARRTGHGDGHQPDAGRRGSPRAWPLTATKLPVSPERPEEEASASTPGPARTSGKQGKGPRGTATDGDEGGAEEIKKQNKNRPQGLSESPRGRRHPETQRCQLRSKARGGEGERSRSHRAVSPWSTRDSAFPAQL